jgi:hypothetical protein
MMSGPPIAGRSKNPAQGMTPGSLAQLRLWGRPREEIRALDSFNTGGW